MCQSYQMLAWFIYTERSIIRVIATNQRCVEATYAKSTAAKLLSGLLWLKSIFRIIEKNKRHEGEIDKLNKNGGKWKLIVEEYIKKLINK